MSNGVCLQQNAREILGNSHAWFSLCAMSSAELPEGQLHRPAEPTGDCLILTHGAGANANAPLLVALAEAFCDAGITVLRCDLAFRQARPHGPPPRGGAERDRQGLRAAVASMRSQTSARDSI